MIPVLFARSRADASLVEAATHLIDRAASLSNPVKHLLHDVGFVKDNVKASFSSPFLLVHILIPVRSMAQNADAPQMSGMTLASSTPFEKFGPLVFGNHTLHLQ